MAHYATFSARLSHVFLGSRMHALIVPPLSAPRSIYITHRHFAPKVKGKKDVQKPMESQQSQQDEHLFNIYASIPNDHEMLPDDAYPSWLWDLDKPDKTYGELALTFIHGVDIENAQYKDYRRFTRLHNRLLIKYNNARLQKYKVKY